MRVGIVGYPGSGKTSVFNILTGLKAQTGYGGGRGKANLGVIKVPDERVDRLSEMFQPKKTTHAEIAFVDYAGEPGRTGALDPKALEELRNCDAFATVLRGFQGESAPNPTRELVGLEEELILIDLAIVEKRLTRLRKEGKLAGREASALERIKAHLDDTRPLRLMTLSDEERGLATSFQLSSMKPLLALLNVGEEAVTEPAPEALQAATAEAGAELVVLSALVEAEIAELEPQEQETFLAEMGISENAKVKFIRAAYRVLGLVSFLTIGTDEVRAWTIVAGTRAVKAAGKVHSDIERGFIRAEIITYGDLMALGSEAKVKDAGKARVEGKEYVVQDGDIIHFRFNV